MYSDTVLEVEVNLVVWTTFLPFTLGTPRGTGYISLGGPDKEVRRPRASARGPAHAPALIAPLLLLLLLILILKL